MINELHERVRVRLGEKRFKHTLGVVNAVRKLSQACLPEKEKELVYAAYLHDVTKELSSEEQRELLGRIWQSLDEDEKNSPEIHHSYSAPIVISRDFPEYALPEVLSAVKKHTVGDSDMSLFDEIIFVADYIEENRTYPSCIAMREAVYSSLSDDISSNVLALHRAAVEIIDRTVDYLIRNNLRIINKTILAKEAINRKIRQN